MGLGVIWTSSLEIGTAVVWVVVAGVGTLVVIGFETPHAEVGGAKESRKRSDDVVMAIIVEDELLL